MGPGRRGGDGGRSAGVSFTPDLGEPPQQPGLPQKVFSSPSLRRRCRDGTVSPDAFLDLCKLLHLLFGEAAPSERFGSLMILGLPPRNHGPPRG